MTPEPKYFANLALHQQHSDSQDRKKILLKGGFWNAQCRNSSGDDGEKGAEHGHDHYDEDRGNAQVEVGIGASSIATVGGIGVGRRSWGRDLREGGVSIRHGSQHEESTEVTADLYSTEKKVYKRTRPVRR